jgi:hypothetical protein
VQRLTFAREFALPVTPRVSRGINPRGTIAEYFCGASREWVFDSERSSLFRLHFHRGDWHTPRWLRPLQKTWLARIISIRRPLAVSAESEQAAMVTRPAELLVRIIPEKRTRLRVTLHYCIYFAGRKAEIPHEERRRWKSVVDDGVVSLQRILAAYAEP